MSRTAIGILATIGGVALAAAAWFALSGDGELGEPAGAPDPTPASAAPGDRSRSRSDRGSATHPSDDTVPAELGLDELVAFLRAARRDDDERRLAEGVATLRAWPGDDVAALVSLLVVEIADRPQPRVVDLIGEAIHTVSQRAEDPEPALAALAASASGLRRTESDRRYETDLYRYFELVRALCDDDAERLRGFDALLAERGPDLRVARLALIHAIGELRARHYVEGLRMIVGDKAEDEGVRVAAARALSQMGTTEDLWATLSAITDGVSPENKMQLLLSAARHSEYELAYGMIRDLVQRDPDLTENEFMLAIITMRSAQAARDPNRFALFMWRQIDVELADDPAIAAKLVTALATAASSRFLDALRDIEDVQPRLRSMALDPEASESMAIGAACSWMSLAQDSADAIAFVSEADRPGVRGFALSHLKSVLPHLEDDEARAAFRLAAAEHVARALEEREDENLLSGGIHAAAGLELVGVAPALQAVVSDETVTNRTRGLARETLSALSAKLRGE